MVIGIGIDIDVAFVEGDEFHLVHTFVAIGTGMGDTMQSIGGHFARGDGVDDKLRSGIDIATDDDLGIVGPIGVFLGDGGAIGKGLNLGFL